MKIEFRLPAVSFLATVSLYLDKYAVFYITPQWGSLQCKYLSPVMWDTLEDTLILAVY